VKSRYCNSYAPNQRDELLIGILNVADLGAVCLQLLRVSTRREQEHNRKCAFMPIGGPEARGKLKTPVQ
jgi:hypothetical protein